MIHPVATLLGKGVVTDMKYRAFLGHLVIFLFFSLIIIFLPVGFIPIIAPLFTRFHTICTKSENMLCGISSDK